jgi:hypothetical protein
MAVSQERRPCFGMTIWHQIHSNSIPFLGQGLSVAGEQDDNVRGGRFLEDQRRGAKDLVTNHMGLHLQSYTPWATKH